MRTIKNINPTPVLYNRIKGLPTIIATTFNNKDIGRKKMLLKFFVPDNKTYKVILDFHTETNH